MTERPYKDQNEIPRSLSEMMRLEPEWVMSRFHYMRERVKQLERLIKRINRMKPSVACDAIEVVVRRIENNKELPK